MAKTKKAAKKPPVMKKAKAARTAPKPVSKRPAAALPRETISVPVTIPKEGVEAVLGAAFLMTDRAYAWLRGGTKGKLEVELAGKKPTDAKGLEALAEEFKQELEAQKVRWAIARNNLSLREYIVEQALVLANGGGEPEGQASAEPPMGDQLTDDQRLEIEKLIAEVETEIKAMNEKKAVPDPKNIKASWEEKQETPQATDAPPAA